MSDSRSVARCIILDMPLGAEGIYDYLIASTLRGTVGAGFFARVAFGRSERVALIAEVTSETEYETEKLKEISSVLKIPPLSKEEMQLVLFLKERTFCSTGQAISAIRPGGLSEPETEASFYPVCSEEELVALTESREGRRRKKQSELLRYLFKNGKTKKRDLVKLGFSSSVINAVLETNLIAFSEDVSEPEREPEVITKKVKDDFLTSEQQKASDALSQMLDSGKPACALLYGITGSGKTRVIKSACDKALSLGKNVIILIPEIALSPQTSGFFKDYYGNKICVWHSGLSVAERRKSLERIRRGDYRIVIGTRSAIFAPLENIGLIVIDEEQEHTYKSEMSPRYKAHDIAALRCGIHGATLCLSSATPSVETMYKAQKGEYTLLRLNNRYGGATLPGVEVADLRIDFSEGKTGRIGSVLRERLAETISKGEQAILFLNRRGFHNFLGCPSCGNVIMCPNCSISLTHHFTGGRDYLKCHVCGYTSATPKKCPECGSEHMLGRGFGTQLVEEELTSLFGEGSVIRMDADMISAENTRESILKRFRDGCAPILLGTQMVTKGHDFPNVTLAGVIYADSSLYVQDYRANEQTFSAITQIVGRSGRSEKSGSAVIQTDNPEHYVIGLAMAQDYDRFYKNEIALRHALVFPPYCDILTVTFSSSEARNATSAADFFVSEVKKRNENSKEKIGIQMFGPFEAPVYKVNRVYSMRTVIKFKQNKKTRAFFTEIIKSTEEKFGRKISISPDINPVSL